MWGKVTDDRGRAHVAVLLVARRRDSPEELLELVEIALLETDEHLDGRIRSGLVLETEQG